MILCAHSSPSRRSVLVIAERSRNTIFETRFFDPRRALIADHPTEDAPYLYFGRVVFRYFVQRDIRFFPRIIRPGRQVGQARTEFRVAYLSDKAFPLLQSVKSRRRRPVWLQALVSSQSLRNCRCPVHDRRTPTGSPLSYPGRVHLLSKRPLPALTPGGRLGTHSERGTPAASSSPESLSFSRALLCCVAVDWAACNMN